MPGFSNWRVFFFAMLFTALFTCSTLYISYKIEQLSKDFACELTYAMQRSGG